MINRRTVLCGAMILTHALTGCQSLSRTAAPPPLHASAVAKQGFIAKTRSLRRFPRRTPTAMELGFPSEASTPPQSEEIITVAYAEPSASSSTVATATAAPQAAKPVNVVIVDQSQRSPKKFGELLQKVRRRYSNEPQATVAAAEKPAAAVAGPVEKAGLTITQKPSTDAAPAPALPPAVPDAVVPDSPAPLPDSEVVPVPTTDSTQPPADLQAPQQLVETDPAAMGAEVVEVHASPADGQVVGFGAIIPMDEKYGVGADQAGLIDNISARGGASMWSWDDDTRVGFVGIVESTAQIGASDLFVQGGVGAQNLGGDWPITGTVGMSKLARIEGDEVVKPLVLSFAYDSFYDDGFLDSNRNQYLDQYRVLLGWALTPRLDVGVWGAASGGWHTDQTVTEVDGRIIRHVTKTGFADRAAGYASFNIGNSATAVITSVGWQEYSGVFAEADAWMPVNRWLNLWGGVGYSGNNSYDAAAGVEVIPAGWVAAKRYAVAMNDCCDPCDPCCDPCAVCCASCGPRYRGGWANGVYRGALRVMTPARAQRTIDSVERTYYGPLPQNSPPEPGTPVDPPPDCGCHGDKCLPRIEGRPTRQGNLSTWMQENGYTSPTNIPEP